MADQKPAAPAVPVAPAVKPAEAAQAAAAPAVAPAPAEAVQAAEKPSEAAAATAPEPKMPAKMKMASLYGFYDENQRYREWKQGDIISDASEIKLLMDRQAPAVEVQ